MQHRITAPLQMVNSDILALFDPLMLHTALQQPDSNKINIVKAAVNKISDGLQHYYEKGGEVNDVVFGRAQLTDRLLACLYGHFFSDSKQPLAIVAVGGYGRGELHPKSDIDLMLLLDEEENADTRSHIEQFLMLLWDSHLEIGHSVRTLDECVTEAKKDITITTNIMEARLIAGHEYLFTEMKQRTGPDKIWGAKNFFQAKLEEQIQRNGKFNDTAYNLEPNIKESHGGLRDIQMIGWVAKRHFNVDSLEQLVDKGFLLDEEYRTLHKGQHLLWRIRCSLHYLAGRREDRLLFDYQRQLALEFGFKDNPDIPGNEAIEQFMQQYYRTVIQLEQLNEMLLQHFREVIIYADETGCEKIINENFQVYHGYIEIRQEDTFEKKPTALLELFLILEKHTDIQGVRARTIRKIRQNLYLIDDAFRQSASARKLFISIMSQPRGVTHELRRMNRYGILAAYIPAFNSIVGRMQYDLFHAYTVDQHTLFVVRNIRRLSVPDFCHEFPLASGIFQHLEKPYLLCLSGLFHDIAKGRNGDHSELGAVDAYEFCIRHEMNEKDATLVSWLVASHLIMSMTAQRRDLSDPDVIAAFAEKVGSLKKLDYLYLLTMCDIRATNPKQWNNWKDKLLSELYNKTASLLNLGLENKLSKMENIIETQTSALRLLEQVGIHPQEAHFIWNNLSNDYFQSHIAGEIVWHTSLLTRYHAEDKTGKPLIETRVDVHSNTIELMVYMQSRDHIFLDIVSQLSNSEISIVTAHIVNCFNHHALETFRLIPVNISNNEIAETEIQLAAEEISERLKQRLTIEVDYNKVTLAPSSVNKYFDTPTIIEYRDLNNMTRIKVETKNQAGLLAVIARVFYTNHIRLLSAGVHTAGEKAIDYFFITTQQDKPLSKQQKTQLKIALLEHL